jgi:hypothetical protein
MAAAAMALAMSLSSGGAKASEVMFTIVGTDGDPTETFDLPQSLTNPASCPGYSATVCFEVNGVTVTGSGTGPEDIEFFVESYGGGLMDTSYSDYNDFGDQLFTGSASGPTFVTQTTPYRELNYADNENPNTITISPLISATPLPSTWVMLLGGLVGLGFFAYRGTKKGSAAVAAA